MDRLIEDPFLREYLSSFPLQLFVTQMIKLFAGSWSSILDTVLINIAFFPYVEVDCFYLMGDIFVWGTGRAPDSGANMPLRVMWWWTTVLVWLTLKKPKHLFLQGLAAYWHWWSVKKIKNAIHSEGINTLTFCYVFHRFLKNVMRTWKIWKISMAFFLHGILIRWITLKLAFHL